MSDAYALETDGKSLIFTEDRKQKRFELGVCMAVYSWSDLETAVDNRWAGAESADIRDWMIGQTVDLFEENYVDAGTIEYRLLQMMVDEFDVEVDDDSGEMISQLIVKMYQECAEGNYTTVDDLYKKYLEKEEKRKQGLVKPNVVNPQGDDDEDDDDEGWEDEDGDEKSNKQDTNNTNSGPIIDEDGFELVQSNKKKGGR